jgi:GntR family transcriptional regulator
VGRGDGVSDTRAGTALDRSSALPLWAQLVDELRTSIEAGTFGERFPTEAELMRRYAVSRHTVREALRRLSDAGLIVAHQGRGTFVAPRFDQPLGAPYSLYRSIEAQGVEQRSEVRRLALVSAPDVSRMLELPEASELVVLERLRRADAEPLALDTAWLPATVGRVLLDADFAHTALYDELARRCDIHVDGGHEQIAPVVPTAEQRRLLELPAGCGAFFVQRWGRAQGRLVEYRETLIRGDRYRFVARWSATDRYQLDLVADDRPRAG